MSTATITPTTAKAANYLAQAFELVPCDTTHAAFTLSLPTAPPDGTVIGAKIVLYGSGNNVTIAAGGTDVFNKPGGAATLTLSLLGQAQFYQYDAALGVWYVTTDDVPLAQLDARYAPTQPWQFPVAAYGAKGNGQAVHDGAMTASSATLACTTSTPFKATDVGRHVIVRNAGPAGVSALVTTITGYADAGHVTLAAAASTTVSATIVFWATDDTSAIQQAINAAVAYAQASPSGLGKAVGVPGMYGVFGPLVTALLEAIKTAVEGFDWSAWIAGTTGPVTVVVTKFAEDKTAVAL